MTSPGNPTPPSPPPGNRPTPAGPPSPQGRPPTSPAAAPRGGTPSIPTPGGTPGARSPALTPGGQRLKGVALPKREGDRIQRLGRGGFGEVWKVRYLNSEEAWKYLPKKSGSDLQAFRETINARSINHPNVVRVLDITEDEKSYIVRMDLVSGRDLDRVVGEDGVLDPESACRYAIQISQALEAAHRAGVLHLDLKPSNIILKDGGETVMISDFGISATLSQGLFQIDPSHAPGTPYFLAPEQLEARRDPQVELGPGVDIWAMGITLYYLLSMHYPFPFKDNDPTCILTEEPRPLPEVLPYLSDSLWAIVKKMLSRDPRSRYQDMAQVGAAFADESAKVTCPACQRTFPVKDVQGSCPDPACPRPREVVANLSNRALLREGHRLHARCEHQEAIGRYRKVLGSAEAGIEDLRSQAKALIAAAESDQKELARSLAAIEDERAAGDLLHALREVDRTRKRFSTAADLRRIRGEVLKAIREICEGAEQETKRLVKGSHFADAKLLLMKIDNFLGYDPIRRDLEEAGASPPPLRDLFSFVDERENFFATCQKELARRIGALELKEAVACLQRLQRFFPSPENDQQMRLYTELQDSLDFIKKGDLDKIRQALEKGEECLPAETVELTRIRAQCDHILSSLDPKKVPALAEVARRREDAQKLSETYLALSARLKADLEAAKGSNLFDDQSHSLKKLLEIARATDLIPPEEAARFQDQFRKVGQVLENADRKYQEGLRLVRERKCQPAIIALEAAEKMTPGRFGDIPEILKNLTDELGVLFDVDQQLSEVFNRLMGEGAVLEDFSTYFKLLQKTEAYRGGESIVALTQKLNQVLIRLLNIQNTQLGQAADESQRLEILTATADSLLEMSPEMFSGNFGQGSELDKRLLDLFGKVFGPLERGKVADAEVEGRIAHLRGVITEMVRLQGAVKPIRPQEYQPLPAERASAALLACRPSLLYRKDARDRLAEVLALHGELAGLTDDPRIRRQLKKGEAVFKRSIRWISIERSAQTVLKYAVWAAVPLAAAAAVAVALSLYYHAREKEIGVVLVRKALTPLGIEAELPEGAAEVTFLHPLLAGLEDDERAPSDGPAHELARWVGKKKVQLERLEALKVADAAGRSPAGSWNEGIDGLEKSRVFEPVRNGLDVYLRKRFAKIVDDALVLELVPRKFDAKRPYPPLEEAREVLEVVEKLGGPFAGKGPSLQRGELEKLEKRIEAAEEFIRASPGGKDLPAPTSDPEKDVYLLAHLGRLTSYYLQDLAWRSGQVYRDHDASDFEEKLHQKIGELLADSESVKKDGNLGRLRDLKPKNLPERSTDSGETPGLAPLNPEYMVYQVILEILKSKSS